jgi:hypothetical protein
VFLCRRRVSLNSIRTLLGDSSGRHGPCGGGGEEKSGEEEQMEQLADLCHGVEKKLCCGVIFLKPNLELVVSKSSKHLF